MENNKQSTIHHGSGACVTESMSVLADPATYCILNSELTNCPRPAAVLGELAAQWQQMVGTLPRIEQEAVSSQSLANAIESIGRTRTEATAGRLRFQGRRTTLPKELVRQRTNWRHCTRGRSGSGLGQRDRRRSRSRGPECSSDGADLWFRGMASVGRRLCDQVVE